MWTWKLGLGSRTRVVWSLLCLHCGVIQPMVICWEQFYITRPCIYIIIHIYIYTCICCVLWLSDSPGNCLRILMRRSWSCKNASLGDQIASNWANHQTTCCFSRKDQENVKLLSNQLRQKLCPWIRIDSQSFPCKPAWLLSHGLSIEKPNGPRSFMDPPKIVGSLDSGCSLGEALHIDFGCCKRPNGNEENMVFAQKVW